MYWIIFFNLSANKSYFIMKQSEFIITAALVLAAFVFGFYNITNTAPAINNSQMNTSVSIESSNTNEEVKFISEIYFFPLVSSEAKSASCLYPVKLNFIHGI